MYESYFGFRERPFSLTPDPGYLFLSRDHRRALSLLEFGISGAGFTVLTGEVGSGKTLLLQTLLQRLDVNRSIGLISNTHQGFGDIYDWVLLAFGLPYGHETRAARYDEFVAFLVKEYAANRRALLVVDEAQNLDAAALEELRVLNNVNVYKHEVLQTVLVGQPELRETLARHDLRQFAQRIVADYHLNPLTEVETQEYVRHRLAVAGCHEAVFKPLALAALYEASGGVPRVINILCDRALVYAFADQTPVVTGRIMREVLEDNSANGLTAPGRQIHADAR